MQIQGIFSIYDSKAKVFSQPFVAATVGSALRSFADIANDPGTMVARHPEDFALFQVGEWHDGDGVVKPIVAANLGLAASYVNARLPEEVK